MSLLSNTCPFDLQLNGYAGTDFNASDLTADSLHACCERLLLDGAGQVLATVITDSLEEMTHRIGAIARFHAADEVVRRVVRGIHIEGPFIDPAHGYRGAHPSDHVIRPTVEDTKRLVDAGCGLVALLTLAPEHDPTAAVTQWLTNAGICVSAGHCNPSSEDLARAVDAGLRSFTHLGNGCPALMPRHDNIIHRVLACRSLPFVMFIADGIHIPTEALGVYLHSVGIDRAVIVTDATSAAGMGPGRFRLAGQDVVVDATGATWNAEGTHLVGSTISMQATRDVLLRTMHLSPIDVDAITITNPRRLLKC
ncbi:MAG: N-acetylglucosamine-6-phosphate deacetylase [Planctomycetota bacterium]